MTTKSKTREKVAGEYGICVKTLNKWFKKAELTIPRGMICPKDLIKIYELFGFPKNA
jgi:hypothetical protein